MLPCWLSRVYLNKRLFLTCVPFVLLLVPTFLFIFCIIITKFTLFDNDGGWEKVDVAVVDHGGVTMVRFKNSTQG